MYLYVHTTKIASTVRIALIVNTTYGFASVRNTVARNVFTALAEGKGGDQQATG
jgi:hypothetical protein